MILNIAHEAKIISIMSKSVIQVSIDRHGTPHNLIKGLKNRFSLPRQTVEIWNTYLKSLKKKKNY